MKNVIRHKIHFLEKKLRNLINYWNLIPESSNEEFDALNHRILGALMKNQDIQRIKGIIEKYIILDLGLSIDQDEIKTKYLEVLN